MYVRVQRLRPLSAGRKTLTAAMKPGCLHRTLFPPKYCCDAATTVKHDACSKPPTGSHELAAWRHHQLMCRPTTHETERAFQVHQKAVLHILTAMLVFDWQPYMHCDCCRTCRSPT